MYASMIPSNHISTSDRHLSPMSRNQLFSYLSHVAFQARNINLRSLNHFCKYYQSSPAYETILQALKCKVPGLVSGVRILKSQDCETLLKCTFKYIRKEKLESLSEISHVYCVKSCWKKRSLNMHGGMVGKSNNFCVNAESIDWPNRNLRRQ